MFLKRKAKQVRRCNVLIFRGNYPLEKKAAEKLLKKQEAQKLLEEELKTLKSAKPERAEKVTKYEIDTRQEKEEAERVQKGI